MAVFVSAVGFLVAAVGLSVAIAPVRTLGWMASMESNARFRTAIGLRLVLGTAFLVAAPSCRWPIAIQIVGFLAFVAAIGLAIMGRAHLDTLVQWWVDRSPTFLRLWSLVAIGFGVLIIYAGA